MTVLIALYTPISSVCPFDRHDMSDIDLVLILIDSIDHSERTRDIMDYPVRFSACL
jgi:hypothetical protein